MPSYLEELGVAGVRGRGGGGLALEIDIYLLSPAGCVSDQERFCRDYANGQGSLNLDNTRYSHM